MPGPTLRLIMFALGPGISSAYQSAKSPHSENHPSTPPGTLGCMALQDSSSPPQKQELGSFHYFPNHWTHVKPWMVMHGSGHSLHTSARGAGRLKPILSDHFFQQPPERAPPAGNQVLNCMSLLGTIHHIPMCYHATMSPMHKGQL